MKRAKFNRSETARQKRTDRILEFWRHHKHEASFLHAFICISHPFENEDPFRSIVRDAYDSVRIARRLDELLGWTSSAEREAL